MDKERLIKLRRSILALGAAGMMGVISGCSLDNVDANGAPKRMAIAESYSNPDAYYKYVMINGEAVKVYNKDNIYLLFNKKTYDISEYIYHGEYILGGLATYIELYDLESEEMLYYNDGIDTTYNSRYYHYILENNYQVCLNELSDYVEGIETKDYYTLDEIRALEPEILESLKIINSAKKR